MMRSLFAAVSSLRGHQTRMDVIGNNIANVNTVGFKSSRTTFADTLSQTTAAAASPVEGSLGGTNPKQIGLGANVASIDLLFSDGSPQTTGNNTDLALSGNGLFIMESTNGIFYTRDGSFSFDADGNFVLPGSGLYVQGWMADDSGSIYTSGSVTNITVPSNKAMEATQSTAVNYTGNLDASTAGYEIGSILVYYADGTSTSTASYTPTAVPAGTVRLVLSSGETVTLDGTAAYEFSENSSVDGQLLYTSTIASATATSTSATVGITVSTPQANGVWGIGASDTAAQNSARDHTTLGDADGLGIGQLTTGTFIPGGTTSITGEVAGVQTIEINGQHLVQLQLTNAQIGGNAYNGGTAYVIVGDNDYEIGDSYTGTLNVDEVRAAEGATVTLGDGKTTTVSSNNSPPMTFRSTSDVFARYGNSSDGSVTAIDRTSYTTYSYGGKTVDSVTISTTSGSVLDGLVGESYATGSTSQFYPSTTTMFTIYDSLGAGHTIPVLFTKTDQNAWELSLSGGGSSMTFQEDDGSTTTVNLNVSDDLVFTSTGAYSAGAASLSLNFTNGAADMTVTLALGSMTQYSGTSTVNANPNGNAAGVINSISVDTSGVIIGTYSNGLRRNEAQIAIATFTNSAGLTKTSNSLYQESNNSGTPTISTMIDAGTTVTSSALEMSNVELANEFSDMIITQRGFQSNSKMITTADEMLETLINMKR